MASGELLQTNRTNPRHVWRESIEIVIFLLSETCFKAYSITGTRVVFGMIMMFPYLCKKSAVTWAVRVTLVQSLSTLADGSCMGGSRVGVLSCTHMMSLQNCLSKVQRDHIKTSLSLLKQRLTSEVAFIRCYMVGWLQMNLTARSIPFPHNALKCMFNPLFAALDGYLCKNMNNQWNVPSPGMLMLNWIINIHKLLQTRPGRYCTLCRNGYYFHVMADIKILCNFP